MKKILKKYGDSLVVTFSKEEKKIFGLVEGDVIEIDDMLFEKRKKKNGKN